MQRGQGGAEVGELAAIDQEGLQLEVGEGGEQLGEGLASEQTTVAASHDREPDRSAEVLTGDHRGAGLIDAPHGLDEQEIGAGVDELGGDRSLLGSGGAAG
jgi:hypothetical protein